MNENQKKQLATILTAIASIIFSALIASIFGGKMALGLMILIGLFFAIIALYCFAVYVLKKDKTNA